MRGIWLLMVLFLAMSVDALEVYSAPDPEPTSEETLILEMINRMRADPKADGILINEAVKSGPLSWITRGVDMEMFLKEMSEIKKSQPLFFNLNLLDCARKHSFYMIHNGMTHVEAAGLKGFIAEKFSDRIKATGYPGNPGAEDCFEKAPSIVGSHYGFVIDYGAGGTGGMQAGRGHRTNMNNPTLREVGPGALVNGVKFSVTHNMGSRKVPRVCGGVIYTDKNGNNFYDIGEGLGGVKISASDGSSTQAWKSGAFTLDLKSTAKVSITAEFAGQSFSKTFESGEENIKFDWIVPEKAAQDLADKFIQKSQAIADKKSVPYF